MKQILLYFIALSFGYATAQTLNFEKDKILNDLLSRSINDTKYNQRFVIQELPNDDKVVEIAKNNNIFFAKPNSLLILSDEIIDQSSFIGKNYIITKEAEEVYKISFNENILEVKKYLEFWAKNKSHIKKTITPNHTFEIEYPAIEFDSYSYLLTCPSWTDAQANWNNLSGTSALWLSETPWIANGFNNVPVVGLDKVQSFVYLTSSNLARFNTIDGGFTNSNNEIDLIYNYNTAENQTTHVAENHGTATVELGAGKINNFYSIGTAPWSQVRSIDAGTNSGLINTDVYEAWDLINNEISNDVSSSQIISNSYSSSASSIFQSKIATFATLTNGKGVIIYSAGNSGDTNINPISELPYVITIGAVNSQSNTRTKWSGSSWGGTLSDPRHIFAMADGNNTGVATSSWSFSQGNGTSYACPIVAGQVSTYQKFYPNHNFNQITEAIANTCYDLQTTGYDIQTGYGYVQLHKALIYGSSMSLPSSIDCSGNPNYQFTFTPETLQGSTLQAQVLKYPNGQNVPFSIVGNNYVYTITVNTNNGFVNGINQLTYSVTAPAPYSGCQLSGLTKKIAVSNLGTLSINEVSLEDSFSIYPNPANDFIIINNTDWIKSKTLFSITGQLIKQENNQNEKIDISNLQQGLYLLEIETTNNQKVTKKIVKN